jgi:hypothetical protein
MKLLSYLAFCCSITRLGWACTCPPAEFPNCNKEIGFYGEVLSYTVTPCPDSDGINDNALVQIRVDELFKQPAGLGLQAGKIVTLSSPVQSGTCGYFSSEAVGKRFLLTLSPPSRGPPRCDALQTDTNLSTIRCDGNIEEPSEAQVRAYVAACGAPPPSTPSPEYSGPPESPPQVPDPAVDSTCLKECGARCARRCQRRCRGLRCNRRCGSRCASRCGAVCK